jgi:hypothetical protein
MADGEHNQTVAFNITEHAIVSDAKAPLARSRTNEGFGEV